MNRTLSMLFVIVALFMAFEIRGAESDGHYKATTIPDIENEWGLKQTAIMERSEDGSYQQIIKTWEHQGKEGLTLSVISNGKERYIARAWKNDVVVWSAVQPKIGEWIMIRFSLENFKRTAANINNPTKTIRPPEGIKFTFIDADGNAVEVIIILDPHFFTPTKPPFSLLKTSTGLNRYSIAV